MTQSRIRVLIVDDSSVVRTLLSSLLASDPGLEVVGTAPDPYIARDKLIALQPDVMTLDIEMPKMDGVTFLGKVMRHVPIRTLVLSSLAAAGSKLALEAYEAGAIDVMAKPEVDVTKGLTGIRDELVQRVKMVAAARLQPAAPFPKQTAAPIKSAMSRTTHRIIAIASSTGGTEALKVVLSQLPANIPGILIVQHMPPVFTKAYADALKKLCAFDVREAQDGDRVIPGQALLAPGNFHMELARSGALYYVRLHQEPALYGVRPAADYLMKSVAKIAGANAVGVVLTGMGRDGAAGLKAMRDAGSYNIAQDEASCVVFGMPKAAIELGAIDTVETLQKIPHRLMARL